MPRFAAAIAIAAVAASIGAAPAGAKTVSFTGQSIATTDPTQTNRLSQNGVVSSCAAPKSNPGSVSSAPRHYDEFAVANDGPGTSCVHVALDTTTCGANQGARAVAYQPTFNPASITSNYKADQGNSDPAAQSFSFGAAPGGMALVVHGADSSGLCANYSMTARVAPSADSDPATNVAKTSATLHGTINEESESSTAHFEYGTTTSYGSETTAGGIIGSPDNDNHNMQRNVTGLQPGTTYHYRTVIDYPANGSFPGGTAVGQDRTFQTPADPTAATAPATALTAQGATLNGTVNPRGLSTTASFEYGKTASYGSSTAPQAVGSDNTNHSVSAAITGLEPATTYHYRVVAVQGTTVVNGGDATFTTPPLPPTVTTAAATDITTDAATLNGSVDPGGAATTFKFEFGETTSYGSSTSPQPAGSDHTSHPVSASITGLEPGKTYHYRLVAQQGATIVNGEDATFTTVSLPPPPDDPDQPSPGGDPVVLPADPGPGPASGPQQAGPLVDGVVPAFTQGLKAMPSRFRAAKRGASVGPGTGGTRISFALSEPAGVTFTVERALPGRRANGRCQAPSRRNRSGRPCTRFAPVRGSFSHAGTAGPNALRFTGRVGGKSLVPGSYRLIAVAADDSGNRSAAKRTSFKIVR